MAVCALFVGFVKVPLITLAFVALNPPVNPPVTLGALQLYKVPAGIIPLAPFTGLIVNKIPLQVVADNGVIVAAGFSVTISVKLMPVPQLLILGVTVYVAVTVELVVLVNVPVILLTNDICDVPPVKPDPVGAVQLKVVPAGTIPFTPSVGVTVKVTPLQVIAVIVLITAPGLTFTVIVKDAPAQIPDNGVTK